MVTLQTNAVVSPDKVPKENHHDGQNAHPIVVCAAPVNLRVTRAALGTCWCKQTELSTLRHAKVANGVTAVPPNG
jgi:hypothetical protein